MLYTTARECSQAKLQLPGPWPSQRIPIVAAMPSTCRHRKSKTFVSLCLKTPLFLNLDTGTVSSINDVNHYPNPNAGWLVEGCPASGTTSDSRSLENRAALPREPVASAVLCCSDAGECTSQYTPFDARYTQNNCIFVKSGRYTYYGAATVCIKINKRLCTKDELVSSKAGNCCTSDCPRDPAFVWTNSIAPGQIFIG